MYNEYSINTISLEHSFGPWTGDWIVYIIIILDINT